MTDNQSPIIIGRFYFTKTKNGNLLGEFSNNLSVKSSTEGADLIKSVLSESYIGEYLTTWSELNNCYLLTLLITYKPSCFDKIYTLTWLDNNKKIKFWGEGFICDNLLVGDYRNFSDISSLNKIYNQ